MKTEKPEKDPVRAFAEWVVTAKVPYQTANEREDHIRAIMHVLRTTVLDTPKEATP